MEMGGVKSLGYNLWMTLTIDLVWYDDIFIEKVVARIYQVKQALEYVYRVENSQCTGGTEEVLNLAFNNSVWSVYTEPAIRTANFLTEVILENGNLLSLTDEILFTLVRNNIHGGDVIFGSAIAVETSVTQYDSFCPYAYKKNGTVYAHDIAINYNYKSVSTEWYQILKVRNWDNITRTIDKVRYRSGNTLLPSRDLIKVLAKLEDGHWTKPYFDCGGGDIWMVTYSSPLFYYNVTTESLDFKGVATIDIELTNIDINQCDPDESEAGALDVFRGTHSCMPSTQCVFEAGLGFKRGAYKCVCKAGYYFPDVQADIKYFSGIEIERLYAENNTVVMETMRCKACAAGCDTCVDASPCLYQSQLALRLPVLILTIITVVLIVVVACITYNFRFEMAIKTGSPIFLLIMCTGSMLMCTKMFITFPDANDALCILEQWLFHTGFVLMYGALLLKTWRISIIFRVGRLKRVYLPDKVLLQRMIPLLAVAVAYLAAWTASDWPKVTTRKTINKLKFQVCVEGWWSYGMQGAEAIMLLAGVYLCFTVRKAPAHFNESKHITWSTYNAIILGTFLVIVIHFISNTNSGPDYVYLIYFLQVQVFVTITSALIFTPKFYALYKNTEVRDIDNESLPTITRTVTGREKVNVLKVINAKSNCKTVSTQTEEKPIAPVEWVGKTPSQISIHLPGRNRVHPTPSTLSPYTAEAQAHNKN
ncbi:probable G-protein coupled receptor CG31760 [Ylistrum balloti]|uniref:probable G-protein coupled receptor CG31760 n=1 Tax=Ylistrum balloti TaxID=509963 RepID=UPI002905C733|nr:probable G-protein coupled receptor CG31760 [Ylistrum balloti]